MGFSEVSDNVAESKNQATVESHNRPSPRPCSTSAKTDLET
jgi:hypothetical protein